MFQPILFLLGAIFCIAAIIGVSSTAQWSIIYLLFLSAGITLLSSSMFLRGKPKKFWRRRSVQKGTNAIAVIISVFTIVSLINIFAIRHNQHWNFSPSQIENLSPLSKTIVKQLEQPLEILIFDRNINPDLKSLLEKYRHVSTNFQFRFVNPEQDPGLNLAKQYEVKSLGEIYLHYGDKKQKLDSGNVAVAGNITENQLTNSIEKINQDRDVNIYFLQGHGEAPHRSVKGGIAQIINSLEDKGNNVSELNLATNGKIPDDANLIVIAGATRKLLSGESKSLQAYLSDGGSLLLLLSPNVDIGIDPLLQEWGMELDTRLVVDGSDSGKLMGFGPGVVITNDYGSHPITASFGRGISVFPESRPLQIVPKAGIKHTPLAISNEQTWAESDLKNAEITFDSTRDLSGPLNIAIALEKENSPNSRMVVFGSSTFITNGWFEQQLNSDIAINSINWMLGKKEELLTIQPRYSSNRRIHFSSTQGKMINFLALQIVPALALIAAIFNWYKCR